MFLFRCRCHTARRLTKKLTHAGPRACDCQLRRDPGVVCSDWLDHQITFSRLWRVPGRTPNKLRTNPSTGMRKKKKDQVLPINTTVDSFHDGRPAAPRTAKPIMTTM